MARLLAVTVAVLLAIALTGDGIRGAFSQELPDAPSFIPDLPGLIDPSEAGQAGFVDTGDGSYEGVSFDALAEQIPSPPALGTTVLDTPLTSEGVFGAVSCPTGRGSAQFRPDGYRLAVSGACRDGQNFASVSSLGRGVTVPDGDVEAQFRILTGLERVRLHLYTRLGPDGWYRAQWEPTTGIAVLAKMQGGTFSMLARRADLRPLTASDPSHTLALRTQGAQIWVLIDGQPALSASDSTHSTGGIEVDLERTGPVGDAQEVSALMQRLRVSTVSGGAPNRAPTVQQQPAAAPAAAPAPAPKPSASPAPAAAPAQAPGGAPAQVPAR
jgi:hypothetical protein